MGGGGGGCSILSTSSRCRYKFRANPINPKIFNKNGLYGVPKRPVDQVSTTVPESPHLATKERMESRKRKLEDGENPAHYEFHAHPIQKGILEGVKVNWVVSIA